MNHPIFVEGHGVISAFESLEAFPDGTRGALPKADLNLLARTLRRGLSDVTRLFLHAAQDALTSAEAAPDQVHLVFASAFGELHTAEALLQQAREENSASPARFKHSVHNTSPGLLSISAKNTLPSTALAAGWNTVAMGLLEAQTLLACGEERVLLVFAEEHVPSSFSQEHGFSPLAAAFVLTHKPRAPQRVLGQLAQLRRAEAQDLPKLSLPFTGENHPLAPAVFLARALQQETPCTLQVGEGPNPWCIDLKFSYPPSEEVSP